MTVRTLGILSRVTMEFFAYEGIYATSEMIKLFFGRVFFLTVAMMAIITLVQSVIQWPAAARETGEEQLVMQGEFRAAQDRNKEIQLDLRNEVARLWISVYEIKDRQTRSDEFHRRIEEKFDTGVKILWAMASLLILQVIVPLARMMLGREIMRAKKEHIV